MAVSRVTVEVVVLLGGFEPVTFDDNFLALEVVGFMKLWLVEGVVRRAFAGLEGVRVADDVILMGLERILGVE